MEWDDEVLCTVLERSFVRGMLLSSPRRPEKWESLPTPFHNVRIEDGVMAMAPRCRIDNTRKNLWLQETLELARDRNCSTISSLTTKRLTPSHHEEALLEHGFTKHSEGHILGAPVNALNIHAPQLHVETTGNGKPETLGAALRVSSALWGTPSMEPAMVTAVTEALAEIQPHERMKHDVVVWINDQPAGIAHLNIGNDVGTLDAGATLPEHRRRGAYTATVDARLRIARSVGCRRVVAHTTSAFADGVLRSRGLQVIDTTTVYILNF